jgi:hypothetical protein
MSRILKRPMFRRGGSSNEGIMTGLVDRKKYNLGSPFDEKRTAADVEAITGAMDKYAALPKTTVPLGQVGLNLISGRYAGDGLLKNIAGSAQDPYAAFTKADDVRNMALAKRKAAAVSTSLGQQRAERNALKKAKAELAKSAKEDIKFRIKQEDDLLKLYKNDKSVQNFAESSVQLKKMLSALEQNTGAGDVAAIFAFMKTLDPNSVVRESEFEVAEGTGGAKLLSFEKAHQFWQKLKTGERLTDREKENFRNAAIGFYQADQSSIDNIRSSFENIITDRGLNKANVFVDNDIRPFNIETKVTAPVPDVVGGEVKQTFDVPPGTKLVDYMDGFYYFELPDGRRFRTKGLK